MKLLFILAFVSLAWNEMIAQDDTLRIIKDPLTRYEKLRFKANPDQSKKDSILKSSHHEICYPEIGTSIDLGYIFLGQEMQFPDTVTAENSMGTAQIICFDAEGRSVIKNYYHNGKLQLEGQYIESKGPLTKYFLDVDPYSDTAAIAVKSFFQPIPDGKWYYYDFDGSVIKEITYDSGIKRDSTVYKTPAQLEFNKYCSILFWQDSIQFMSGELKLLDAEMKSFLLPAIKSNPTSLIFISCNVSEKEYAKDALIGQRRCSLVADYFVHNYHIKRKKIFIDDSNRNIQHPYGFSSSTVTISIMHKSK